jgi:hypothetical protein
MDVASSLTDVASAPEPAPARAPALPASIILLVEDDRVVQFTLEQQLSRRHPLAVLDMNRADRTDLDRLDHLDITRRHDLAARHSNHIDPPENRPQQRNDEQPAKAEHQNAQTRARRLFHDLKRRRQKLMVRNRLFRLLGKRLLRPRFLKNVPGFRERREPLGDRHAAAPICFA